MKLKLPPQLNKTRLFSIAAFLLLCSVLLYLYASHTLEIKKIHCSIDQQACPDYIQAELEKHLHQSLLFTRYDQIIATILKRQPSLEAGQISKKINGEVTFTFQQAQPLYALKTSSSPFFIVDKNGVIITAIDTTTLPQILLADQSLVTLTPGVQLPLELHTQLEELSSALQQFAIPYTSVSLSDDQQVQIQLSDGKQAVVLLDKAQEELPKLQFLLNNEAQLQQKENFHLIDLRFKYPILKM